MPRLSAVTIAEDAAATRFTLLLTKGVRAEVYTLSDPFRVIVDMPDVVFEPDLDAVSPDAKVRGLVADYRYGLFSEGKARVVIDTTGPVRIAHAGMTRAPSGSAPRATGGAEQVIFEIALEAMDAASFGRGTGAMEAPNVTSRDADLAKANPDPPLAAAKKQPVIMIDPGHGGVDPGATGASGVAEKTVVLAVARLVAEDLKTSGGFDVRLTRERDVFVSLDQRLKMSRAAAADLFISLHADSIAEMAYVDTIRGASIYTLSERASDEQARLMAEKENASDLIAGLQSVGDDSGEEVKDILIDLMKRETSNFSAEFSSVLTRGLSRSIQMSRNPQRSAAFKVLKQPHAPSVLVELGYISNPVDQERLTAPDWQKKAATAIAAAVRTFFSKRLAEQP
jgi:N-acetylmuramoyl-L-alanine amidase